MSLTERVREVAIDSGAALVGFAPISRFENAPPEYHPKTIYPGTRTVIAIGIPQARGTLKAAEEGTYWQSYNVDSYQYLNETEAPRVLRHIVMALEDDGYTSVPIHNPFHTHTGRQVREDQPYGPDGLVSLRLLAVAAGLGELGLSKVFLSPEFGPRQRIYGVFTDAELDPTPLFTGSVCDECGECIRECEAGAIGNERSVSVTIDGHEFRHAPLDTDACFQVHWGLDPRYSPFWNGTEAEGEVPSYNTFCLDHFRHLAVCVGRGCLRSCLDHLEKTGRIEKQFETPFIERKRWKLNEGPKSRSET